jgi:methylase of polypeptide subunit release factors
MIVETSIRTEAMIELQHILEELWPFGRTFRLYKYTAIFSTDGILLIESRRYRLE